jgi:hypothetical protein
VAGQHLPHAASMNSTHVSNTELEGRLARKYRQTLSSGISSGAREGNRIMVTLPGIASRPVVCHPALLRNRANHAVKRTGGTCS